MQNFQTKLHSGVEKRAEGQDYGDANGLRSFPSVSLGENMKFNFVHNWQRQISWQNHNYIIDNIFQTPSISPFYYLPLLKNAYSCLQNGILNIIVEKYAEICFHFPAFYYGGGFSTLSSM